MDGSHRAHMHAAMPSNAPDWKKEQFVHQYTPIPLPPNDGKWHPFKGRGKRRLKMVGHGIRRYKMAGKGRGRGKGCGCK